MRRLQPLILAAILGAPGVHAAEPTITMTARETFPVRAFVGTQPLPLQLNVTASAAAPADDLLLRATLTDASDAVIDTQQGHLGLAAGKSTWIAFALHPPDFGFYRAQVVAIDAAGAETGRFDTAFAVLSPRADPPGDPLASVMGVNFHFEHRQGDVTGILELMRLAGIRWLRDQVYWEYVERVDGVYEVSATNRSIYQVARERYGIRTLVMLGLGHPRHGRDPKAYGAYCREVARQLRGIVDHFEIWNEPNAFGNIPPPDYADMLEAAYLGVKEGNPDAFVVGVGGASPGGWGGWYLPKIIELGKHRFMDTFSVHPYTTPSPPDIGYATQGGPAPLANLENADALTGGAAAAIQKIRGLKTKPRLWITELGWPSNQTGLLGQAQGVSRAYLMTAALPDLYERLFIYDFLCDGPKPDDMESNFGMIDTDYSVRPSYVACASAARALAGRTLIRRLPHPDPTVRLYLFGPENAPMLAAWCTEVSPAEAIAGKTADGRNAAEADRVGATPGRSVTVHLGVGGVATASLNDWQDRASTLTAPDGKLSLRLTGWPVFLYPHGSAQDIRVLP
jgi:hypothetical protein